MTNQAMMRALETGECLSLRKVGEPHPDRSNAFRIHTFVEGRDYADPETGRWCWEIARHRVTGELVASTVSGSFTVWDDAPASFEDNPDWECIWMR